MAIELCKELAEQYQSYLYDYMKLGDILVSEHVDLNVKKWTHVTSFIFNANREMKSNKFKKTYLASVELKIIIVRPDLPLFCQQLLTPTQTAVTVAWSRLKNRYT